MTRLLARCSQLKEFAKIPGRFKAHDAFLQLLAPIPADDVPTQRGELNRNFIFGHGIARKLPGSVENVLVLWVVVYK